MHSPREALVRLNTFDRSYLNPSSKTWIGQIKHASESGADLEHEIDVVIEHSHLLSNPWGYAEFLLNLAVLEFENNRYKGALEHIRAALDIFPPESQRAAVSLWILGWVEWARSDPYAAYSHWMEARQIFLNLHQQNLEQRQTERITFYLDCLKEINIEMVSRVEELYTWLNAHEPSHLSEAARSLVNSLMQSALEGNSKKVYQQVSLLQKVGQVSEDYLEAIEIIVECGMALYQVKNFSNAASTLRRAAAGFPPGSHRQAVARWMAGLAQWQVQSERDNAINNWQQSIKEFEGLEQQASRSRNPDRAAWYEERIEVMKLALVQKISQMQA
jgi:tetratricopeptide (TPR) repeat protein